MSDSQPLVHQGSPVKVEFMLQLQSVGDGDATVVIRAGDRFTKLLDVAEVWQLLSFFPEQVAEQVAELMRLPEKQ